MAIDQLTIIGESINDSVPSTKKLFDANDIDGLLALARLQDERGAGYIDVNVGGRSPQFMAELVERVQQVTTKPLSIDTPDLEIAKAGLEAYDQQRAGGQTPLLNSVTSLRTEMFDLYKLQPFKPILLVSEHEVDGRAGGLLDGLRFGPLDLRTEVIQSRLEFLVGLRAFRHQFLDVGA